MYYFIINPSSRSGQGREVWKQVRQLLKKNSLPYKASFYPLSGTRTETGEKSASGAKKSYSYRYRRRRYLQ